MAPIDFFDKILNYYRKDASMSTSSITHHHHHNHHYRANRFTSLSDLNSASSPFLKLQTHLSLLRRQRQACHSASGGRFALGMSTAQRVSFPMQRPGAPVTLPSAHLSLTPSSPTPNLKILRFYCLFPCISLLTAHISPRLGSL